MPVVNWPIVTAITIPNLGLCNIYFIKKNIRWFQSLKSPRLPPRWIFAPTWIGLYSTMGYTTYTVWRDGGGFEGAMLPLTTAGVNLILNWLWTPIFFSTHNIKLALCESAALWVNTATLVITFHEVKSTAGYLNIPYLIWMTCLAAFNYCVYKDNKPQLSDDKNIAEEKIKDVTFK